MDTTEREWKSPVRKLIAFFQKSRDGWRATQQASQVSLKKEQNQVRAVEKSRANWRAKAEAEERLVASQAAEIAALKKGVSEVAEEWPSPAGTELVAAFEERAVGQSHSVGLMQTFVRMVVSSIGYQPAARALSIVAPLLPGGRSPSANGGQMWVLRMGLSELRRAREVADDGVWLIDHSIQAGRGKCFVVLAVRLSCWRAQTAAARVGPAVHEVAHEAVLIELARISEGDVDRLTDEPARVVLQERGPHVEDCIAESADVEDVAAFRSLRRGVGLEVDADQLRSRGHGPLEPYLVLHELLPLGHHAGGARSSVDVGSDLIDAALVVAHHDHAREWPGFLMARDKISSHDPEPWPPDRPRGLGSSPAVRRPRSRRPQRLVVRGG